MENRRWSPLASQEVLKWGTFLKNAFNILCSDHRPFGLDDSPRYRVIRCVAFLLCLVSLDQYNIAFSEADGLTYRLFGHAA